MSESPLVYAHRGFRGVAPENTLAAARAAVAAGADGWELDVAASADGVLVVIHDDSLARTTDACSRFPGREPWPVYAFSYEDIRSLDAGSWYGESDPFGEIAAGRVERRQAAAFAGERVPTLREALEFTRDSGLQVNVEIKDASGWPCDAWIVERSIDLARELGLLDRVLLSSFNHDYLRRARTYASGLALGALVDLAHPPAGSPADPVALVRACDAQAWHPSLNGLAEVDVRSTRAAGLDVNVWTVNKPEDMERLLSWGVTGLITDYPDRARSRLPRI